MIVLLNVCVLFGTAALDLAQYKPLKKRMIYICQITSNSLIEFFDSVQPGSSVVSLMRSCLDQNFLLSLLRIDENELDLWVDDAKLFNHLVSFS